MPDFERMLSQEKLDDLCRRFCSGLLDSELKEKIATLNPELTAKQFRFLKMLGVSDAGDSATSDQRPEPSVSDANQQMADVVRMNKRKCEEVATWTSYLNHVKIFSAKTHAMKEHAKDEIKESNRTLVEREQERRFPIRTLDETGHVPTFVQSSVQAWCDYEEADKNLIYQVYFINCCILGYDAVVKSQNDFNISAAHLAEDPQRSCLLVIAPNTGSWGNEYNEDDIRKAIDAIDASLRHQDLRMSVSRVQFEFDENSIHGKLDTC